MTDRVLRILEFDKIREMLMDRSVSEMGRELCALLVPSGDFSLVTQMQRETIEADSELTRIGRSPVDSFPDSRFSLKKSRATLALGTGELLSIARGLKAIRFTKASLTSDEHQGMLANMANTLHTSRTIEDEIFRCILSEDEIADNASARLFSLRRSIRACNERVREKLNSMLKSSTYKNCLQDGIITMRNGRYVLAVKQEHRSEVPGLLHDQSGSGATLFIEPMAVVEIGNELKQFMAEETEEIQRILCHLTQLIAPESQYISDSLELMAELDLIFAKAKLARDMRAVPAKLNSNGYIRIIAGRHPLIDKSVVVPTDIWLGDSFTTLIITGPNTGGKTVTLKTVGLFSLMNQSGLYVPCEEGSQLAVFDDIFADIGDEQSIAQNLSTFSSHMKNIVDLLSGADKNSLVLVDELGSGTDPVEGAALAMSVLEKLHGRGARTLATTHYSELKAFALTTQGMENASVEFDVNTLRPTYRLFVGIPGKSNAFEISRKLGLGEDVIEGAQKHLTVKDVSFEDAISGAESQRKIAEEERRMAEAARAELYKLRDSVEEEKKLLIAQRDKSVKKAKEEAKAIIVKAKAEAERIIKELKNQSTSVSNSDRSRAIQKARDDLRCAESGYSSVDEPEQNKYAEMPAPKSVNIGDTVYILSLDNNATVLSKPDSKGEITVQAGILKLSVKLKDVRILDDKKLRNITTASVQRESSTSSLEIDVRGMTVDEGIIEVDRYIDTAFLSGIHEVSIIHGKGTGALRNGIQSFLKGNKHVKSYRLGLYGEGETGVTVVTLK